MTVSKIGETVRRLRSEFPSGGARSVNGIRNFGVNYGADFRLCCDINVCYENGFQNQEH